MKYKQCNVNVSVPRCPRRRGCLHPGQLHRWCLPWRYRPCGPRRSRRGPSRRPRPRAPRPRGDRILRNPPWRQGSPRWTRCPRTPGGRCRRPGTQRPPIQGPPPSSPCRWARPPGRSPRWACWAVGILRQLLNGILQHNHNNQQQHCLQGEVCGVFSNTLILQSGAQELPCNLIFSIKNPAYLSQHQQQLGSSEEQCIQHPFSVPWEMQTLKSKIKRSTFKEMGDTARNPIVTFWWQYLLESGIIFSEVGVAKCSSSARGDVWTAQSIWEVPITRRGVSTPPPIEPLCNSGASMSAHTQSLPPE